MPDLLTPDLPTLEQAMRQGAARLVHSATPQLDARVLMKAAANYDDVGLITNAREITSDEIQNTFSAFIERRMTGEPVAYITGVQEFWSLKFQVTPDVLIPRSDSECLIEEVLARRVKHGEWSILDLGVGSGCLLASLLHEMPNSIGFGVDKSQKALAVAKTNAASLGVGDRASFLASDWCGAIKGAYDIIITNPPYIPLGQRENLPVDVSGFEPGSALFAGWDGLDGYRAMLVDLPQRLALSGLLAIEVGDKSQADCLLAMLSRVFPPTKSSIVNDLSGRARCILIDMKSFTKRD